MPANRIVLLLAFGALAWQAWAQTRSDSSWNPRLLLDIRDCETGEPAAARFSLAVDGQETEPRWIGVHGLRFASVHVSKRQSYIATYARGTGVVEVPLPAGAQSVEVRIAKGFDYRPLSLQADLGADPSPLEACLERWHRLREDGWRSAETHLHYDRPEPEADRDWFDMMAGDDLALAEFMVLKGGMVPGIWAEQYAYGADGEQTEGDRTIVPGEEYRDRLQGHNLLFGLSAVIQPIMAGVADAPHNWPALADVFERARAAGGLVGPAHGGTLGESPTAIADALLGKIDFWEIGNAHLWELDDWYRLMNVGVMPPPIGGTDLPNNPYRDAWQPFLGSMRTYVRSSQAAGARSWHAAISGGDVYVTSGPVLLLAVNGESPGATVRLPPGGGEVEVEAQLASPRPLEALELISNGQVRSRADRNDVVEGVNRIVVRERIRFEQSGWVAARGRGGPIEAIGRQEVAHTGAVRVLVGDEPIWDEGTAAELRKRLREQQAFYADRGAYPTEQARRRMADLFDEALGKLSRD